MAGREGKDGWTNNHKGYVLEWCLCSLASVAPRIWPKPRDKYLSRLLLSMRALSSLRTKNNAVLGLILMANIKVYKRIKGIKVQYSIYQIAVMDIDEGVTVVVV